MRAMRRFAALLASATLMVSCTAEGGNQTTTTSPAETTSTVTVETTTTTAEATTTTALPSSTSTTTTSDPLAPEGSGCTPGTDVLSDGEWYGGVRGFDDQGFSFDLACLYIGDAAEAAAAEDGEESPPPNDYYVRNESDQIRMLTVHSDTPVTWYPSGDPNDEVTGTYAGWIEFLATQESYLGIWITVENGVVTETAEWWVP